MLWRTLSSTLSALLLVQRLAFWQWQNDVGDGSGLILSGVPPTGPTPQELQEEQDDPSGEESDESMEDCVELRSE